MSNARVHMIVTCFINLYNITVFKEKNRTDSSYLPITPMRDIFFRKHAYRCKTSNDGEQLHVIM